MFSSDRHSATKKIRNYTARAARGQCSLTTRSNLGIEIEERLQTCAQLLFDFFLAALQHVHHDMCLAAIAELYRSMSNFRDFFGGQQPHAIHQRQVSHMGILRRPARLPRMEPLFEIQKYRRLV